MSIAYAHGLNDHTGTVEGVSLLTQWSFDPTLLVLVLVAFFYYRALYGYRRRGGHVFPIWRMVLFGLGSVALLLSLASPIDYLADRSFTWHMVQHDLILLVAVPLVMLGAPFIPVVRGMPRFVRDWIFIPLAKQPSVRRVAIYVTSPIPSFCLYEVSLLLWHYPSFYDAALYSEGLHIAMHANFGIVGVFFWWNLITPYPFQSRLHPLFRILMLFGSAVVNGALSAMIVFSGSVQYAYQTLPEFWGLSMLDDQTLGSSLMWVMGGMIRLTIFVLLFAAYARAEEAKEPRFKGGGGAPPVGRVPAGA